MPFNLKKLATSRAVSGGSGVIEPLSVTANGTYNPPDGVDGYSPVTVSVASLSDSEWEEQFKRAIYYGQLTQIPDVSGIREYTFYNHTELALTSLPATLTKVEQYAFYGCTKLALTSLPETLRTIGTYAFYGCTKLALTSLPERVSVDQRAFGNCQGITTLSIPANASIYSYGFINCANLKEVTFCGKPRIIKDDSFYNCTNLLTINVPWAEGEVSGAPWGATNATINYNYTGG